VGGVVEPLDRLRELIARHAYVGGGIRRTSLDGVRLTASDRPTEPLSAIAEPALAVVAQGVKQTVLNDRVLTYGAGQFLVVSVALPLSGQITAASGAEPFLAVVLTLRPTAIAALLLETAAEERRPDQPTGIAVSDAGAALLDALARLLDLLDHPEDTAALAPAFERELLWRLITSEQGASVREIGLADSRLSHVARAIGWIRNHYAETMRIEQLAAMSAMSRSSFHRHFRAVTTMTPIQYQKQIRLQEARARLLAEPGDVAGVGFAVGYQSPSQFSREYRRTFGVSPARHAEGLYQGSGSPASIARH
jgi:AraC-like DNA-binding protein